MEEQPFVMPTTPTAAAKKHVAFPAVAQFLVLIAILGGLLGGVVLPYFLAPKSPYAQKDINAITSSQNNYVPVTSISPATPLKATAVHVYDVTTNTTLYEKKSN
ncbi:MAG: hypothetical protein RLZZ70_647, partial [Candidatus Parcubacteria bacterium]